MTNPVHTHIGVLTWVLTLNQEVERVAANVYYGTKKKVDLIDVSDWHFIPAAVTFKKALGIPFVYSVESLEDHRSHVQHAVQHGDKKYRMARNVRGARANRKISMDAKRDTCLYQSPREKVIVTAPPSNDWIKQILKVYPDVAEKGAD